jgi:predicted ATP-binding protein involved in virulence
MRIKQVSVTKLFGVFDHRVDLNLSERVTIVHGPNGFGKTVLLTMIESLFRGTYSTFLKYPFENFIVVFDDSASIEIRKVAQGQLILPDSRAGNATLQLAIIYTNRGEEQLSYSPPGFKMPAHFPVELIEDEIPELRRIEPARWLNMATNEVLGIDEVVSRFWQQLPFRPGQVEPEPEWLLGLRRSLNVHFIQTQRLLTPSRHRRQKGFERERFSELASAVASYSEELAFTVKSKLAEYAEVSQNRDSTFPRRLVAARPFSNMAKEEILAKLAKLKTKRQNLVDAGLLDETKESIEIQSDIEETKLDALTLYVNDVEEKLSVFDTTAAKIELFKRIIGSRFLFKKMTINKEDGLIFTTVSGDRLSLSSLSSGEQHELVLLYSLLFKVSANSLILIDEPEISLHVYWQRQFLRDLLEMARLSNFDAIVATHSPQIINNKWDLTVELRSPDGEEQLNGEGHSERGEAATKPA